MALLLQLQQVIVMAPKRIVGVAARGKNDLACVDKPAPRRE